MESKDFRIQVNKLVGKIGNEFVIVESIFNHRDSFYGVTGDIVVPVTDEEIQERYDNYDADHVCAYLAQNRILIRNCTNFKGLSGQFIRFSLKTPSINAMFADKLLELK